MKTKSDHFKKCIQYSDEILQAIPDQRKIKAVHRKWKKILNEKPKHDKSKQNTIR